MSTEENAIELSKEERIESLQKQLEFFFSDANLARDKFQRKQMETNAGGVPIEVLLRYNLIKKLTTESDDLITAAEKSEALEVSGDKTAIKRVTPYELVDSDVIAKCSLFIDGIPTTATLKDCIAAMETLVENRSQLKYVQMRRSKKSFSGSILVQFESEDLAKSLVEKAATVTICDAKPSKVMLQTEWELIEKPNKKDNKEKNEQAPVETVEEDIVKGCVIKVEDVGSECTRELLKQAAGVALDKIAYVNFARGDKNAEVRFACAESAAQALENLAKADIGGAVPSKVSLLEGEEEEEYWKAFFEQKRTKNNKRGGFDGRGGRKKKQRA